MHPLEEEWWWWVCPRHDVGDVDAVVITNLIFDVLILVADVLIQLLLLLLLGE